MLSALRPEVAAEVARSRMLLLLPPTLRPSTLLTPYLQKGLCCSPKTQPCCSGTCWEPTVLKGILDAPLLLPQGPQPVLALLTFSMFTKPTSTYVRYFGFLQKLHQCKNFWEASRSGENKQSTMYIYLYRDKLVQSSGNHGLSPSQMHAFPFQGLQNQDNLSTSPWERCPQVPPCPWLQEEQGGCSWPWRSCTKPHTTVPCPPTKAFRGEKLGREMSAHNTS